MTYFHDTHRKSSSDSWRHNTAPHWDWKQNYMVKSLYFPWYKKENIETHSFYSFIDSNAYNGTWNVVKQEQSEFLPEQDADCSKH